MKFIIQGRECGGCVNQVCVEKECVDCGLGTYFSPATDSCETDPCAGENNDICGGNLCDHNKGIVTCSCLDEKAEFDEETKKCKRDCSILNGGCINQKCEDGECVDCEMSTYYSTRTNTCEFDPCFGGDSNACGGNICSHTLGDVTCSCEIEDRIFDPIRRKCIRNCAKNNGGCIGEECFNGKCVPCAQNEFYSETSKTCEINPCTVESVCGGNLCSHDQGRVTCSCSEENYKYDAGSNSCVRDCESNNGGCVDSECINNKCVACEANEYFNVAAEECQTDPCTVADVCGGNLCSHDQGSVTCSCSDKTHVYSETTKTCNPATECRKEDGLQVGSDGVTCTSIPEAKK